MENCEAAYCEKKATVLVLLPDLNGRFNLPHQKYYCDSHAGGAVKFRGGSILKYLVEEEKES